MKLSRPSRFVAALIALFGVLFMQLAVAAYVCPAHQVGELDDPMAMPVASLIQDTSNCMGMDLDHTNLCGAHDQIGTQSLDKPDLSQTQSGAAAGKAMNVRPIEPGYHPPIPQSQAFLLTRTIAPPLAIRNCCFRI